MSIPPESTIADEPLEDAWIIDPGSCRASKMSDGAAVIEVVWYDLPSGPGFALSSYSGRNLDFERARSLLNEAKVEIAKVKAAQ